MNASAWLAAACVAAGLLAACGLSLEGLGVEEDASTPEAGLDARPPSGDATTSDGAYEVDGDGADEGASGDGAGSEGGSSGQDATAEADAGGLSDATTDAPRLDAADGAIVAEASAGDGCSLVPENCLNGLDDNCNGLIDCEDPACTTRGYSCVVPAPAGWTLAALDITGRPGCPTSFPTTSDLDVDPADLSSPAVCNCSCTLGAPPSCVQGNISTKHGPDNMCNGPGGGGTLTEYPADDGGCVNQPLVMDVYALATQPPFAGGSCTLAQNVERPTTGATPGELCSGGTTFGAGCDSGKVCAQFPDGFGKCVLLPGTPGASCPSGPYGTQNQVGNVVDTRACEPCSCSAPTGSCQQGTWSFYTAMNCTGTAGVALPTNDQCTGTGVKPPTTYQSHQFASVPGSVNCADPAPVQPTGDVTFANAQTVCCE